MPVATRYDKLAANYLAFIKHCRDPLSDTGL